MSNTGLDHPFTLLDQLNKIRGEKYDPEDGGDDAHGERVKEAFVNLAYNVLKYLNVPVPLSAVVAKMRCQVVESTQHSATYKQHKVKLSAIYGKEGENKDFADATPSGECWMQISSGRPALEFFEPGQEYYVTFTKAPKATA